LLVLFERVCLRFEAFERKDIPSSLCTLSSVYFISASRFPVSFTLHPPTFEEKSFFLVLVFYLLFVSLSVTFVTTNSHMAPTFGRKKSFYFFVPVFLIILFSNSSFEIALPILFYVATNFILVL